MSEPTRGGKRKGAGRKPAPAGTAKVAYGTKLTPEVVEYLKSLGNAAVTLDETVRRSKGFREYRNDRK